MPNQGFSLPRNFKGSAEIRPNLERNFKQLTSFLNTYVPTYNNDDDYLYLRGGAKASAGYSPSANEDLVPRSYLDSQLGDYLPLSAGASKTLTGALYTSNVLLMTAAATDIGISMDSDGAKRITWNDGHGHFNIAINVEPAGSEQRIVGGNGAGKIVFDAEGLDGRIDLEVADVGTAGSTITWQRKVRLNNNGLFLSKRGDVNEFIEIGPEGTVLASGEVSVTSPTVGTTLAVEADTTITLPYSGCPVKVFAWGQARSNSLDYGDVLQARIDIGGSAGNLAYCDLGVVANDATTSSTHTHTVTNSTWATDIASSHNHTLPGVDEDITGGSHSHSHNHDINDAQFSANPIEYREFTPSGTTVTIELLIALSSGSSIDFCKFTYLILHGAD